MISTTGIWDQPINFSGRKLVLVSTLLRLIFWWNAPPKIQQHKGKAGMPKSSLSSSCNSSLYKVTKSSVSAERRTQRLLDATVGGGELGHQQSSLEKTCQSKWKRRKASQNAKNREWNATGKCFLIRCQLSHLFNRFPFFEWHRTCWRVSYWVILDTCRFTYQEYDSWLQHWLGLNLNCWDDWNKKSIAILCSHVLDMEKQANFYFISHMDVAFLLEMKSVELLDDRNFVASSVWRYCLRWRVLLLVHMMQLLVCDRSCDGGASDKMLHNWGFRTCFLHTSPQNAA